MSKIAVFFGSSTGNTEDAANSIAEKLGAEVFNVADNPESELSEYDNLIFGSSTWGIGDLQDDWEEFISTLEGADLNGKVVAIFGFGDSESYPDSFVDAIGTIYETVKDKGCKLTGQTDPSSYTYDSSNAEVDGKFVGLPLDEENQGDLTEERIDAWLEQIKKDFI